jgi:hypothetical protein
MGTRTPTINMASKQSFMANLAHARRRSGEASSNLTGDEDASRCRRHSGSGWIDIPVPARLAREIAHLTHCLGIELEGPAEGIAIRG